MKIKQKDLLVNGLSLLIVIGGAFLVMIILIFILSKTPFLTINSFFSGPFTNRYYLGNMFNNAIPLIFTGLGISLAFRSSMFNLGGEGQVYFGGLVATAVCLSLPNLPGPLGIILALTAAVAAGAVIAGLSGIFKYRWGTDELLSSFLISSALLHITDFFITGVLHDPESNLITTPRISEQFRFFKIYPPSNLDVSLFLSIIAGLLAFYYLFRTRKGYEHRMCGLNREFARYGGIKTGQYIVMPMFLSGGFHGLAGAVSILGTHYMCLKGFSAGMGWNGIAVALIARNNPAAVIPAALFFSYIESGAKSAMISSDVTLEISAVVQSIVFFFITSRVIFNSIKYRRRRA
ncbi:MAG: ABC transporter permease [Spirochaetales bacterium]|nr:ABC transporter permease [Spirochaetales bacterium]